MPDWRLVSSVRFGTYLLAVVLFMTQSGCGEEPTREVFANRITESFIEQAVIQMRNAPKLKDREWMADIETSDGREIAVIGLKELQKSIRMDIRELGDIRTSNLPEDARKIVQGFIKMSKGYKLVITDFLKNTRQIMEESTSGAEAEERLSDTFAELESRVEQPEFWLMGFESKEEIQNLVVTADIVFERYGLQVEDLYDQASQQLYP